jgi:hypothetical protein
MLHSEDSLIGDLSAITPSVVFRLALAIRQAYEMQRKVRSFRVQRIASSVVSIALSCPTSCRPGPFSRDAITLPVWHPMASENAIRIIRASSHHRSLFTRHARWNFACGSSSLSALESFTPRFRFFAAHRAASAEKYQRGNMKNTMH